MKTKNRLALCGFISVVMTLLLFVPLAVAQEECHSYEMFAHWAGYVDVPGRANAITLDGDNAYFLIHQGDELGFFIVDISNPTAPTRLGSILMVNLVDMAISNGYAYVIGSYSSAGLHIIDVSDPSSPSVASHFDLPTYSRGITISGDYAYIAIEMGTAQGLQVIDISDPISPLVVGSVSTPGNARCVAVSGNYAYVGETGGPDLQIVDISDPSAPAIIGSLEISFCSTNKVDILGDYAYLSGHSAGLVIIDISIPESAYVVGTANTYGYATAVAISGDYAYVADGWRDLQVVDISTPSAPILKNNFSGSGGAGVAISGDFIFSTGSNGFFHVFDFSNPEVTTPTGHLEIPRAWGVAAEGNYAYVADRSIGLVVVDISTPASPTMTGNVNTPGIAQGVVASGGYAYVADGESGLQVVDPSLPATPAIIGSFDTPGNAVRVFVAGDHAFVADFESGLQIINISDPTAPSFTGSLDTPDYAYDVAVSGDFAYVADGYSGLEVISISSLSSPTAIGSLDTPGYAQGVTIQGDFAYVADGASGLQIIDISNPVNPTFIATIKTILDAYEVYISGSLAYVACGQGGMEVIDISLPSMPQYLGSLDTQGIGNGLSSTRGLGVGNGHLLLADDQNGLVIASPQCGDPVPLFVSYFLVEQNDGHISIEWHANFDPDLGEFRLLALCGGTERIVPFECDGTGRLFSSLHSSEIEHTGTLTFRLQYRNTGGQWNVLDSQTVTLETPRQVVRLLNTSPNPFNPKMTVAFEVEMASRVEIAVFDLMGHRVALLSDRVYGRGRHTVDWEGCDDSGLSMASGTYLMRMQSEDGIESRKVMLAR